MREQKPKIRITTIRMPACLHDAVKYAAGQEGLSVNSFIRSRFAQDQTVRDRQRSKCK